MNQLSSSVPSRQNPLAFLYNLIRAHPSVESPAERRQAELLAALSLASALADLFFVILSLLLGQWNIISVGVLIFGVISFVAYLMSRSTRHKQAALLFVSGAIFVTYLVSFVASVSIIIPIITFTFVFLLSNLLELKWIAGIVLVNAFLAILGIFFILPQAQGIDALVTYVAMPAIALFVLLFAWHRESLEKLRLGEVLTSQKDLELSNLDLQQAQQQVNARLDEIKLAAEVGRAVSQVRSLDDMLADAVERIRAQFDLYYTQVYLINPSQTFLEMKAGTGEVGQKLRAASHRLPLNASSINGRSALEKSPVIISETTNSPTFKPNPLLPATRSEMAVPLIVGEQVIGVLDMQSEQPGSLSEAILPAFEALAGQLAIAIQNARLLEESKKSYAELQKYSARLSRENWAEYLDAIYKPETIGFVFEQGEIHPLTEAQEEDEADLSEAILVGGAPLGRLTVKIPENAPQLHATQLLALVSSRVAQHIENLRLLESSERYRLEAEQASRRLTREGWEEYFREKADQSLSYLYDLKEVKVHEPGDSLGTSTTFSTPIKVGNETIGKLAVFDMDSADPEALELVNTVSERLSEHIETLRLTVQTQSALAQSEKLFGASQSLVQATDLKELVKATVGTLNIPAIKRATLEIFEYNDENELTGMTTSAAWWDGTGTHGANDKIGEHFSIDELKTISLFLSTTPVFFNDTLKDDRLDAFTLSLVKERNIRAGAVLPLFQGKQQVGFLLLVAEEPYSFTPVETRLFTALAPQITTVLQNVRSFNRAQRQADREAMLNAISQKIQSATSVEAVLQIAARELGHALNAPRTIAQLSMKDK